MSKLLYSKSKVNINTAKCKIPGNLALVEDPNDSITISWLPETILKELDEEDKFVLVESTNKIEVIVNPPPHINDSYAFNYPISDIYSIMLNPPSISNWYGTVTINLQGGVTLPVLHFHDDEITSSSIPRTRGTWGGNEFISCLRLYISLLQSQITNNLFLVDPNPIDKTFHQQPQPQSQPPTQQSLLHYALNPQSTHSQRISTRFNSHQRDNSTTTMKGFFPDNVADATPAVNNFTSVYQNTLTSFANISRFSKQTAHNILSHPLAQPILPHLPTPVQSRAVAGRSHAGEYDSARIYLAKWARKVAEEGDRNSGQGGERREGVGVMRPSSNSVDENIQTVDGSVESDLGNFQLLNVSSERCTRDPTHPITLPECTAWFDHTGKPLISESEMRERVFRRGTESTAKSLIWPFILSVIPWDTTHQDRQSAWDDLDTQYVQLKSTWKNLDVFHDKQVTEERHRIRVDCLRTDRNVPLFAKSDSELNELKLGIAELGENGSTSGSGDSSEDKHSDSKEGSSQAYSNVHVRKLQGILLTYNFYEKGLGYVQGMSDLIAPLYVISEANESTTFWLFVNLMNRTKENFAADQKGMSRKLITLQDLIRVMDPQLYQHFKQSDNLNMFFCFRWILVMFKREFLFSDIITLWEALFTRPVQQQFELFVALAVLESHRDIILRYLMEFDEMLKYCNDLSGTIDVHKTLNTAQVLYDNLFTLHNTTRGKNFTDNLVELVV